MSFKDAGKILSTIEYGDQVERVRSNNRRKVDDGFNGVPPLSAQDAAKMGLAINEDFGEMAVLGQQARRQYTNAFLKPSYFFKVKIPSAPTEVRMTWESKINEFINRPMKDSLEYFELIRSKFACVVAHGIGPQMWLDNEDWLPECIALEDLRVPTDTKTSLKNLTWFALRRRYTVEELSRKGLSKDRVDGWQQDQIVAILKEYKKDFTELDGDFNWENPEHVASIIKQNGGYYQSDASPSIPLWHFYFVDEKGNWFLRVVAARECRGADASKFVFDNGESPVADSLRKILHVQFGDLNSKAPFLWHSVRSLGFLLRGPCFWQNIFYCRVMAHCMENMNIGFRVSNPSDQGRVQKLEMMNKFVLPSGVQIIPNTERHQINEGLIETTMAQIKRLQGEASVSFTQELPTGNNKEMTATETLARVSQVNALMSGLLLTAFTYERFAYQEIARRFCIKKTENKDARKFQEQCRKAGIPDRFIDSSLWIIEPEVPLGSGNPTMEMAQAKGIMDIRNLLPPDKQDFATHMYIEAMTGDPNLAEFMVPAVGKPVVSEARVMAQLAFGTLMQGIMVEPPDRLNPIDQIETLLGMMAEMIQNLLENGGMAEATIIKGFYTVAQYITLLTQRLEQDPNERQRVRQYSDDLNQLMNEVKGFEQRLQEQMEAQAQSGGMSPEAQGKITEMRILAEQQARSKDVTAAQKMAQQQQKFVADQERKDAQTAAEIERKRMLAETEASLRRETAEV